MLSRALVSTHKQRLQQISITLFLRHIVSIWLLDFIFWAICMFFHALVLRLGQGWHANRFFCSLNLPHASVLCKDCTNKSWLQITLESWGLTLNFIELSIAQVLAHALARITLCHIYDTSESGCISSHRWIMHTWQTHWLYTMRLCHIKCYKHLLPWNDHNNWGNL